MRITDEDKVLNDQALRKEIIKEINGGENQSRKDEAFRRNLCLKDKTKHFTVQEILKQFDVETVQEMSYSITNVSIARKIIDKLARVYSAGVSRLSDNDANTAIVEETAKLLKMNQEMKRTNRYLRAHRNVIAGVLPCPDSEKGKEVYSLQIKVLQPYLYDVIEHEYDRERAMFYVLSDYKRVAPVKGISDAAAGGRGLEAPAPAKIGDNKDQHIADAPADQTDGDSYIWWSEKYHFTTNVKGEIIAGNSTIEGKIDTANPIGVMPWQNFALDQDGAFWAEGGEDVFDASVQINCMLSNLQHIGVTQGYGQFWMKGKGLPRVFKHGPNKAILMEQESKDDPDPQIGFASANPMLSELKDLVIMHVALTLTTNNLSTRSVATELAGSQDFPSGVALVIDKAESIEDVSDQQQIFRDKEPKLFDIAQRWQELYNKKGLLKDEFKAHLLPQNPEVKLNFLEQRVIMSEKEKLEVIKLRKDLGINTMIELLKIDDPSLSDEDAEKRLAKVLEEAVANKAKEILAAGDKPKVDEDGNPIKEEVIDEGNGEPGEQQPDDLLN